MVIFKHVAVLSLLFFSLEQGMVAILYINGGNGPLDGSQVENWPGALPPSQCGNGDLELGEITDSCYPSGTCPLDIGIQEEDVCCLVRL